MGRVAGLLLFVVVAIGCSKPSLVGTWQSASNPPAQFLVTVRGDGTYSMLATTAGPGHVIMRYDGKYTKSGDAISLAYEQANFLGGDILGEGSNIQLLAGYLGFGSPSQLQLVNASSSTLTMSGHGIAMSRVTGSDISPTLSAEERAFADQSNGTHVIQGGKWTVHKVDNSGTDTTPPEQAQPQAPAADAGTQAQPTDNSQPVDISTSKDASPPPDNSASQGQDQTAGGQAADQTAGNKPPDNPPTDNGTTTGDNSGSTTGAGNG